MEENEMRREKESGWSEKTDDCEGKKDYNGIYSKFERR